MAQFDVYINPNPVSRKRYPYLVDIQNNAISEIATRLVIPLGHSSLFRHETISNLTPEITFEDIRLLLLIPQISSIPAKFLESPIGTLSHYREELIKAVDFAITGY